MNQMTNEEIDTALILENELKKRVHAVVERVVVNIVGKVIHEELNKYKTEMMLEVAISVGAMLRSMEQDGRKPLWESDFPVEIKHAITKENHAIREQTPSL
jgi:hypothetical protein